MPKPGHRPEWLNEEIIRDHLRGKEAARPILIIETNCPLSFEKLVLNAWLHLR